MKLLALAVISVVWAWPVLADQNRLQSSLPRGFVGEGHAENHAHYQGLHNKQNGSCCNGQDCRPTQARWNNHTAMWEAMVDGVWQAIENGNLVLDDAWLQLQHTPRWDSQAHVCAAQYAGLDGIKHIYCLIPPGSGQ